MNFKMITTTKEKQWQEVTPEFLADNEEYFELTDTKDQEMQGFGGCFNEMSWEVLKTIDDEKREEIFKDLFAPQGDCRFNFCRLPVGANDYSMKWYSLNETEGDYEMKNFSIERDKNYIIPYIKKAQTYNNDIKFFASPWSPPTWMKNPPVNNYGVMIMTKENLDAYALYFLKFVKAYAEQGIKISQIHVQNEPMSSQKFPSCIWTGEQFRIFIRDYIGPLFEKEGIDTEIWLGTLNGPETDGRAPYTTYDDYANVVLSDKEARKYIKGVSYQWAGKYGLAQTRQSYPELQYMQSENECGHGDNSWEYARYVYQLYRHYITNGVNSYIYWNMVLPPEGRSTWGWTQNAMITINPETKEVIKNPEYYVMKHFSHFVQKGAKRIVTKGHCSSDGVAFENPNGEIVCVIGNMVDRDRQVTIKVKGQTKSVMLKALSYNTIVID